jgi:serine/threonine protein kinase/Tol biopolymer transport system component
MTPSRFQQIEELYRAALKLGPEERTAYLVGVDPDLRREVEALLASDPSQSTVSMVTPIAVGVGFEVAHYRIDSKLGEGGMGSVYRALDTKLNRLVAIKFLSDDLADAAARRRFQREAQMASSLNHPHILTVHDIGEWEGRQYIVTEYVDGGTLKQWALQQKRSWKQLVELLTGVADGLAAAHDAKILHRDIKPANILVAKNGYAKLADFGLAKLAEDTRSDVADALNESKTRPGMIIGTIAYMSPEQASGLALDARSDVFSFGVVLYEMLAGKRPFTGATDLELLKTIIHGEPEVLGEAVPPPLRNIVAKSLEKDPAERFQSMRDMTVDLRRAARESTGAQSPHPVVAKARRPWVTWGAAAGLVLAAVVWLALRTFGEPANPLANARFTRLTDFPGDEVSAAISQDGKFAVFLSDREGAVEVWMNQIGSGLFQRLTEGRIVTAANTNRDLGFNGEASEIWLRGPPPAGQRLRLLPLMGGTPRLFLGERVVSADWSRDGKRIVYFSNDPGDPLMVADRDGSNAQRIFVDRPGGHNHFPIWSTDGRWIYFVNGNVATLEMDLWRIPSTGGEPERLTHINRYIGYPTPLNARNLVYVAVDADGSGPWLWAFDVDRKAARRVSFGLERYTSISASAAAADGSQHLVASVANPAASLWSVPLLDRIAEEGDAKPYVLPNARALAPRFGGKALFYLSSQGGGDALWRFEDGQASQVWQGSQGALQEPPAISTDGRQAAVVVRNNGRQNLRLIATDGSETKPIADSVDVRGAASWSPDGMWIITGGNDGSGDGLFKIPAAGGTPVRLVTGAARNPVWSPDGSLVAYAGPNSAGAEPLRIVRSDGSPVTLPFIGLPPSGERIRFSPDGKSLFYMQGSLTWQDFWLLDLATKKTRQLTQLNNPSTMRTFDITPDGKQIVFDRSRQNSDIVLIDLPK